MSLFNQSSIQKHFLRRITTVIAITVVVFTVSIISYNTRTAEKELKNQMALLLSTSLKSLSSALWQYNHHYINDYVDSLFQYEDVVFVRVAVNAQVLKVKTRPAYKKFNFYGAIDPDRFIFRQQKIKYNDAEVGDIILVMTQDRIRNQILFTTAAAILLLLVIIASITITIYQISRKYIFKPLKKLENSANQIAAGHLDTKIEVQGNDEIGQLAIAFKKMMLNIKSVTASRDELNHEISERKRAEDKLTESNIKFVQLANNIEDVFWLVEIMEDESFNVIYVNPAFEKMWQRLPQEIYLKPSIWYDAIHDDDKDRVYNAFTSFIKHQGNYDEEYRLVRPDGSIRVISVKGSHIRDKAGRVVRAAGISRDITNRKQVENALAQEKERLMVTLRSIGDGVITTDTRGRVVILNKVAESLTGWSQGEARGKPISDVFHIIDGKTRKRSDNPIHTVLETEGIIGLASDTVLISKNGTERIIADSGAPIFDVDSKVIGVVLVFRDISEKYQLEKQLQQAQKMESIGTLAGGIAHDFNNLLGVITGNATLAISEVAEDDSLYPILRDIKDGAKEAEYLTHQLLTFAKGGAPIKKASDLNQIIRESARFVTRGEKVNCDFKLDEHLWAASVDPGQINQTLSNLVINATHAMPDGGTIEIKSENVSVSPESLLPLPLGNYIIITVADKGIGIPEAHLHKIFDPYFSTKQKGSGLGLATSYSIIQRHGGHISVTSTIGEGSTFRVYLPATDNPAVYTPEEPKADHVGTGHILIMDDQEQILKMTDRVLKGMGYTTDFARNGEEAIQKYQAAMAGEKPFDMVILDLTIPGGMGGATAIKKLLEINPDIIAVVSSGYSNDPVMANYQDYGFSGVVPKPFTRAQVAELLNSFF